MTNFTARGICLEIKQSPYFYEYENFKFFFTSKFYLEKFKKNINEFLNNECKKLEYLNYCKITKNEMSLLKLYKITEKRDFYVLYNHNGNYEELENINSFKILLET